MAHAKIKIALIAIDSLFSTLNISRLNCDCNHKLVWTLQNRNESSGPGALTYCSNEDGCASPAMKRRLFYPRVQGHDSSVVHSPMTPSRSNLQCWTSDLIPFTIDIIPKIETLFKERRKSATLWCSKSIYGP